MSVEQVLNKRLLGLLLKVIVKTPEIEYLHYGLQIVNHALKVKLLRQVVCTEDLRSGATAGEKPDEPLSYPVFLRNYVEKQAEVISIDKLHKKVVRQRKELEQWALAMKNSSATAV